MTSEVYFSFTSEAAGEGHPDKVCDQISDAIVDECLKIDTEAYLGIETAIKGNMVIIFGEITMKDREKIDCSQIARDVLKDIGYDDEEKGIDYKVCNTLAIQIPIST
jgi:S-adenosylmethionine synthetase